jgi:hypothetical protein
MTSYITIASDEADMVGFKVLLPPGVDPMQAGLSKGWTQVVEL